MFFMKRKIDVLQYKFQNVYFKFGFEFGVGIYGTKTEVEQRPSLIELLLS